MSSRSEATQDFDRAVTKAFWRKVVTWIRGDNNELLPFDEFSLYPLIPYPGTLIATQPDRYGYEIVEPDFTRYIQVGRGRQTCFALRHSNFGPEDVQRWLARAEALFAARGKVHTGDSLTAQ